MDIFNLIQVAWRKLDRSILYCLYNMSFKLNFPLSKKTTTGTSSLLATSWPLQCGQSTKVKVPNSLPIGLQHFKCNLMIKQVLYCRLLIQRNFNLTLTRSYKRENLNISSSSIESFSRISWEERTIKEDWLAISWYGYNWLRLMNNVN